METEEHLLALKVMRLTHPTLASSLPVTCDSKDLPGNLLNTALQQDPTAVPGTETLSTGQFLLLPQSPVNIYLGETFSSYICIFSDTKQVVNQVTVKVELQTTSQKLCLSSNEPTAQLTSDETVNIVIHHEVKEVGAHILICEVSYHTDTNPLPMTFRKFFKIQVLKPLDVKTKFYTAENDDVFLEAQVENITNGPIFLDKVELDASHLFNVLSLDSTVTSSENKRNMRKLNILQPRAISQYLYCLTPNEKLVSDLKSLSGATNVGKLDIVWRSNLGEKGRLQTIQLQRKSPDYGDVRLSVIELPNFVVLEEMFTFKCRVTNNGERSIDFQIFLENTSSLTWCEVSGKKLEPLGSHSSVILEFKCIPLIPGLRTICGIALLDTFLKRTFTHDDLGQVFVLINDQKDSSVSL